MAKKRALLAVTRRLGGQRPIEEDRDAAGNGECYMCPYAGYAERRLGLSGLHGAGHLAQYRPFGVP